MQDRLPPATPVFLVARVSASGQAMPQSGDLYGRLDDVEIAGARTLTLDIDHTVP
ncbi:MULTISPECIES: c-type cytochrome biogenesis protein CcmI/CycH [Salinicola]|uniref:c-type cytochrome biogenesis protein CcmI/CycH n=1 Tax=Salinicola TaxID=404432 RepID=UPI0015C668D4|nr:hypothetical protein [Salinicola salarius]